MTGIKNYIVPILIVILACLLQNCERSEALKYAHPNSSSDVPGQYALFLSEFLEEESNQDLKIDIYPSSQLGGVQEMIEGTQLGIINMGHNSFAALSQFLPEIAVFNFPFLYDDIDHAVAATDPQQSSLIRDFNERLIERSNLRIIGTYFFGIRRLTTTDFPVYTPADLRGKKIRAIPLPIWIEMVQGLGAIPTPVDFSELPTALATGMVDGQENPVNTIYASQMYQTQNYLILTDHMIDINLVFMNNDTYESMTIAQQEALIRSHRLAAEKIRKISEELQNSILIELEELGMEVITEEKGLDIEAFRETVLAHMTQRFPMWEDYIRQIRSNE